MSFPKRIRLAIPSDAPGCFLIKGVRSTSYSHEDKITARGMSLLVQLDWDFPSVASSFGWSVSEVKPPEEFADCQHIGTDGTIKCPDCGLPAVEFITAARKWMTENAGVVVENPGYELQ